MTDNALLADSALVIDDDHLMRDFLGYALKKSGIREVHAAASGHIALQLVLERRPPFDIILCDLQMPGMDGIEVIRHLADAEFAGGLVLVSAEDVRVLDTAESFAQLRGLNVLGSINKPATPDAVGEVVRRYRASDVQKRQHALPQVSAEELRDAIASRDVISYFQPKVSVQTRAVTGVETLARWDHPDKGMIPPVVFVDLAERYGLIDELTESMISQACRQGAIWKRRGLDLKVAVNISMDNLSRLDFPDRVLLLTEQAGLPLSQLSLEVTESRLVQDFGTCLDILTRLRLKGVDLSIDDFGTGYASMDHLKRIPFVELKVDRAFVRGARRDKTAQVILSTSVALGQQLNMKIVAEGVEDQQDWDRVEALNCDYVQGYFIAPPMPAEAFEAWLETY